MTKQLHIITWTVKFRLITTQDYVQLEKVVIKYLRDPTYYACFTVQLCKTE